MYEYHTGDCVKIIQSVSNSLVMFGGVRRNGYFCISKTSRYEKLF